MANYRTSRILPTILTVIIIVVAVAGLVALARILFTGSSEPKVEQVDMSQQNLIDTTDGRAVSMTVRGPIVADEDFRSYRIVVTPTTRQFQAFTGYLDTVIDQQNLPNNTAAYKQFVNALDKANMVAGTPFEGEKNNTLGVCATGKVYEFATLHNNDSLDLLWTSTCKGSLGSLKASSAQLSRLFLNQIPESSNITTSIRL